MSHYSTDWAFVRSAEPKFSSSVGGLLVKSLVGHGWTRLAWVHVEMRLEVPWCGSRRAWLKFGVTLS